MSPGSADGGVIALLTDFGTKDPYVGVMKGVILSINPKARLVDLFHEIHPQDIASAYFMLEHSHPYFPAGTVFVAVVDPEVGGPRAILCVETARHLFLAPDNGLLSFLENAGKVRRRFTVTNRRLMLRSVSATFHGRDIFAPVAAHLSMGLEPERVGPPVETLKRLRAPAAPKAARGRLVGRVMTVDRFGNLVTDLRAERLGRAAEVRIGRKRIAGLSRTYSDAKRGELLAYVGSSGTLEIAVAHGSAAEELGAGVGDSVQVTP